MSAAASTSAASGALDRPALRAGCALAPAAAGSRSGVSQGCSAGVPAPRAAVAGAARARSAATRAAGATRATSGPRRRRLGAARRGWRWREGSSGDRGGEADDAEAPILRRHICVGRVGAAGCSQPVFGGGREHSERCLNGSSKAGQWQGVRTRCSELRRTGWSPALAQAGPSWPSGGTRRIRSLTSKSCD